jgi:SpoVK/Ycf46/Vps4 family AAA+-type ATPase
MNARVKMVIHFLMKINNQEFHLSVQDKKELAELTENYSGSDLKLLATEVAEFRWHKVNSATHFVCYKGWAQATHKIGRGLWKPCSADAEGATKRKVEDIPPDLLTLPMITMKDVKIALQFVKVSIQQMDESEDVQGNLKPSELFDKLKEFKNEFGRGEPPKFSWEEEAKSDKLKRTTEQLAGGKSKDQNKPDKEKGTPHAPTTGRFHRARHIKPFRFVL